MTTLNFATDTPPSATSGKGSCPAGLRFQAAANGATREPDRDAPAADADELLADYARLPLSERQRFFLMWNQTEEDFSLQDLKRLNRHVKDKNVDAGRRDAFDSIYSAFKNLGLSGSESSSESESDGPADGTRPRAGRVRGAGRR